MKFSDWWAANRQNIINASNSFFVKLLGGKLRSIVLTLVSIVDAYIALQAASTTAAATNNKLGATLEPEKVVTIKLADFTINQ